MRMHRRDFIAAGAASVAAAGSVGIVSEPVRKARIAITLDLEMSAEYPKRGMTEWNYRKGDLDEATKRYAVEAAQTAKSLGGVIHCFCVGQVLEHERVDWLQELAGQGHPIGNHTYDHVYVLATQPQQAQFRFQRAPWLIRGRTAAQLIRDNIALATEALKERVNVAADGFRTPGGFHQGLTDRPDVQKMLLDLGFRWVSSKYPTHPIGAPGQAPTDEMYDGIVRAQTQAQPFVYPSGLIEIPMSPISDVNAFRTQRWKLEWFLKAVRLGVEWAIQTGGVFDLLAHPSCLVVEDPRFETIKLVCDLVRRNADRAEIVGLSAIASSLSSGPAPSR